MLLYSFVLFFFLSFYSFSVRVSYSYHSINLQKAQRIIGHLFDSGIVELFDVTESTLVLLGDEVDGYTLATEPSSTSDSAARKNKV